tara:strand:+ start:207 stop:437 length:231 start_codon:yes stop_codon:yes gene_type:complete
MDVKKRILTEIERCRAKTEEWGAAQRATSDFKDKNYFSGVARGYYEKVKSLEWVLELLSQEEVVDDEGVSEHHGEA